MALRSIERAADKVIRLRWAALALRCAGCRRLLTIVAAFDHRAGRAWCERCSCRLDAERVPGVAA
jgi:hypothetical protein